jgi:hypothetical protein
MSSIMSRGFDRNKVGHVHRGSRIVTRESLPGLTERG